MYGEVLYSNVWSPFFTQLLVFIQDKPIQEWSDWDGFGPYKYGHHRFANNRMNKDFQRRRIFRRFAEERVRVNAIRKADILPRVSEFSLQKIFNSLDLFAFFV